MGKQKRVLVLGAGAIGGYVGSSLAQAGHDVVFYCRPGTAAVIGENGFTLERESRTVHVRPGVAADPTAAFQTGEFDLLIVAVKRYDTESALEPLRPFSAAISDVLCLQNGIGAEETLSNILGTDRILPGTVTTAVSRLASNHVRVDRFRGVGIAGPGPAAPYWAAGFSDAGLNASYYSDAKAMKWSKLLTNLIANPTSAILDLPSAEIFAHPGLFRLEMQQLREALAVMRARKINVVDLPGTPVRLLAFCARYLPFPLAQPLLRRALGRGRGEKMPSFHSDLRSGQRKSEVDVLHGEVARAGRSLGIPVLVNSLLYETMKSLLREEEDLVDFQGRPEKLLARLD